MTTEKSIIELARMTEDQAREMLERIRWSGEPNCPHCGGFQVTRLQGKAHRKGLFQCNDCRGQFTVTTGTILHRSRVPLTKWILAFYLLCSSKKGISSLQLKRQLGLASYQTAWHMTHRIRYAMEKGEFGKFGQNGGIVEADETYCGGKPPRKPGKGHTGRATSKIPVLTLIDRDTGAAHSVPIPKVSKGNIEPIMKEHIDQSATICTDSEKSYRWARNTTKVGALAQTTARESTPGKRLCRMVLSSPRIATQPSRTTHY
jgi:transposase-like protein